MTTERLLRKHEIAAMLGTSPGVAASILAEHGVQPIDFGYGRSRGYHWLESAVLAVIQDLHTTAQNRRQSSRKSNSARPKIPASSLAHMSVGDIHHILTSGQSVQ